MNTPLVTVVCLCYNHGQYVSEAIESVLKQTYKHIQLIVVDDASTDHSATAIRDAINGHFGITLVQLPENLGNCRAFNKGLALAAGEFVIDLAADDVLMPDRIAKGVAAFAAHDATYGVNFTDALLVDEQGQGLAKHSDRFPHAGIPEGAIYKELVSRYFICSPTMMIRRAVLDRLGGYDESLAYEDFDFWIRSSREYKYCYTPEPLVRRRLVARSLGRSQYRFRSRQMKSTYKVCQKIAALNRTDEEKRIFHRRVRYEMRKAIEVGEVTLAGRYLRMLMG